MYKAADRTSEYALDAEQLVVLRHTLRASRSTSLDLSGTQSDNEVGDDGVLSLTAAVRDHDTPAIRLCQLRTVYKNSTWATSPQKSMK